MSNTIQNVRLARASLIKAVEGLGDESLTAIFHKGCRFFVDRSANPWFAWVSSPAPAGTAGADIDFGILSPGALPPAPRTVWESKTPEEIRDAMLANIERWAANSMAQVDQDDHGPANMSGDDLQDWQKGMRLTQHQSARALGVSLATYKRWLNGRPGQLVALACSALAAGLEPYSATHKTSNENNIRVI